MKYFFSLISFLLITVNLSANQDLNLGGAERWEATFTGYRCKAFGDNTYAPYLHHKMGARFEWLRTDRTLDNGLVKATFVEDGVSCSYTALLFADNDKSTIKIVRSRAFSPSTRQVACQKGRAILDAHLANNVYLYWGHPHHLTIMMPVASAAEICGDKATHVGLDFIVSGKID